MGTNVTDSGKNRIHGVGEYQAICASCGFVFMNYELLTRWDGLLVCSDDWEPRNPLDFAPIPTVKAPLPFTQPDDLTQEITPTLNHGSVCAPPFRRALVGYGTVGCATLGITTY